MIADIFFILIMFSLVLFDIFIIAMIFYFKNIKEIMYDFTKSYILSIDTVDLG